MGTEQYIHVCRAKIHRATITNADLQYEGSITIDSDLVDAAGLFAYEKVHVLNLNSGSRIETYLIRGESGSGTVCLNGAAARHGTPGDRVIVIAYSLIPVEKAAGFKPRIVLVDQNNRIKK
jgi:aspartate 1-decarboxylase